MTFMLRTGVAAIALIAGLGIAAAQQAPGSGKPPQQLGNQPSSSGNKTSPGNKAMNSAKSPGQAPPAAANQSANQPAQPGKPPQTAGTVNPQQAAAPPATGPVFVNGALAAPGAPKDGPTVPAKYSKKNVALDGLPTMAAPLPLTNAQKQQIVASVSKTKPESVNRPVNPSDELPSGVAMHKLPAEIVKQIPLVDQYEYVRLKDKVLLVVAPNRIVVAALDVKGK